MPEIKPSINTGGNGSGGGGRTVPVRAEQCKSSCVDTCPIQFPRTLRGHSPVVWVPVRVDCVSGQEQCPAAPHPELLGSSITIRSGGARGRQLRGLPSSHLVLHLRHLVFMSSYGKGRLWPTPFISLVGSDGKLSNPPRDMP